MLDTTSTDQKSPTIRRRNLSPYEKNHLLRHNLDPSPIVAGEHGEMPVEYITGHVEFMGRDFMVTPDVLIPRIETEELIHLAVAQAQSMYEQVKKTVHIADVGTGSGAIAISLSLELNKLNIPHRIFASDISPEALYIAGKNAKELLKEGHKSVYFLTSDLLENYQKDIKLDLLLANLPYIPSERIEYLDASVKDFEPYLALDGGINGMDLIERLLSQASQALQDNGIILLEVDYSHTDIVWQKWRQAWHITTYLDTFTKNRFVKFKQK